ERVDEGLARSVAVGHFRGVEFQVDVVELEAADGGHDVLDGLDLAALPLDGGAALPAGDGGGAHGEAGPAGEVGADERDARSRGRREQADLSRRAGEEAEPGELNGTLQSALILAHDRGDSLARGALNVERRTLNVRRPAFFLRRLH